MEYVDVTSLGEYVDMELLSSIKTPAELAPVVYEIVKITTITGVSLCIGYIVYNIAPVLASLYVAYEATCFAFNVIQNFITSLDLGSLIFS